MQTSVFFILCLDRLDQYLLIFTNKKVYATEFYVMLDFSQNYRMCDHSNVITNYCNQLILLQQ